MFNSAIEKTNAWLSLMTCRTRHNRLVNWNKITQRRERKHTAGGNGSKPRHFVKREEVLSGPDNHNDQSSQRHYSHMVPQWIESLLFGLRSENSTSTLWYAPLACISQTRFGPSEVQRATLPWAPAVRWGGRCVCSGGSPCRSCPSGLFLSGPVWLSA